VYAFFMPDFGPKWEWVRDLDEGGQGHAFVVKQKGMDSEKLYVLKRLKNPRRTGRFAREIKACMTLQHENILKIEDFGDLPGKEPQKPFLVTEYCGKGNLTDGDNLPKSLIDSLKLFRQICAGVAHAHQQRIAHRDIKPENIFLRVDRTPVVGDFGICFINEDAAGARLTSTLEVAGSRWYCAPELRDGKFESGDAQLTADVYSLGKLLFWMVSGKQIFDREDHRHPRYRIGQDEPSNPAYELINQLLDRCIVSQPSQRIQDAVSLVYEVDQLINVIEAGGYPITLEVPHRCLFCAKGTYKVVVNGLQDGTEMNESNRANSMFGWGAPDRPVWLVMVCDACGNVQIFRPDLPHSRRGAANQRTKLIKEQWLAKRNP
jgi:serine/threonine protein kinase